MKFCSNCSQPVVHKIPPGDNRIRAVCEYCNTIHYVNPNVVAGCIPVWEDKVLLCKRAIEPRHGYWTLPAGFMENQETLEEAAARECLEEANARVKIQDVFTIYSLPHANQIYMLYQAKLLDLNFSAGEESLEVGLYKEEDIPWGNLAFRTIEYTLKNFFADRKAGTYTVHTGALNKHNRYKDD